MSIYLQQFLTIKEDGCLDEVDKQVLKVLLGSYVWVIVSGYQHVSWSVMALDGLGFGKGQMGWLQHTTEIVFWCDDETFAILICGVN